MLQKTNFDSKTKLAVAVTKKKSDYKWILKCYYHMGGVLKSLKNDIIYYVKCIRHEKRDAEVVIELYDCSFLDSL